VIPDSSAILNAVIAKLGSDATLLAALPHGVYEDIAPIGSTRFVIVSQILASDVPQHGAAGARRAYEDVLVLVEARERGDGTFAHAGAQRIDALLEDGTLTVTGYGLMTMHREEFTRGTEVDVIDSSIVYVRRGGRYRVQMATN
jgi:hypothetical protein